MSKARVIWLNSSTLCPAMQATPSDCQRLLDNGGTPFPNCKLVLLFVILSSNHGHAEDFDGKAADHATDRLLR